MNFQGRMIIVIFIVLVKTAEPMPLQSGPTVRTEYGRVRGLRVDVKGGRDLNVFLGIPYAAPPTGERRFSRPQAPTPWDGVRNAQHHGAKCLQRIIPEDPMLNSVPFSEDCLFLDIYTPRKRRILSRRGRTPTMLFIHGGGFYGGTGAKYNFTNMALSGVTVVSINYRLDVLGFLSTQDDVIPGNFGLLDQIQALSWVKENIAAFGGDPEDITLFGGSSGAASVSILTLSPLTRGTFQKAIMTSGAANCFWAVISPDNNLIVPTDLARALGVALECDLPEENFSIALLICLRSRTGELIIQASRFLQSSLMGSQIWLPVVETSLGILPDKPLTLLTQFADDLVPIPTMRGYMKDDSSYYVNDPEDDGVTIAEFEAMIETTVAEYYGGSKQHIVRAVVNQYLPDGSRNYDNFQIRKALMDALTDYGAVAPTLQEAMLFSAGGDVTAAGSDQEAEGGGGGGGGRRSLGRDSFVFEFSYRPSYNTDEGWRGVSHASEKGFVLGLPQGPDPFAYTTVNNHDRVVSDIVQTLWTNFAKFGNPTPEAVHNVTWPAFTNGTRAAGDSDYQGQLMLLKEVPEMSANPRANNVAFWTQTIPNIASIPSTGIRP